MVDAVVIAAPCCVELAKWFDNAASTMRLDGFLLPRVDESWVVAGEELGNGSSVPILHADGSLSALGLWAAAR